MCLYVGGQKSISLDVLEMNDELEGTHVEMYGRDICRVAHTSLHGV
jgi:hypothetical protein